MDYAIIMWHRPKANNKTATSTAEIYIKKIKPQISILTWLYKDRQFIKTTTVFQFSYIYPFNHRRIDNPYNFPRYETFNQKTTFCSKKTIYLTLCVGTFAWLPTRLTNRKLRKWHTNHYILSKPFSISCLNDSKGNTNAWGTVAGGTLGW